MIPLELTIKQHLESMERQKFSTDDYVSSHLLKLAYGEIMRLKAALPTGDGSVER